MATTIELSPAYEKDVYLPERLTLRVVGSELKSQSRAIFRSLALAAVVYVGAQLDRSYGQAIKESAQPAFTIAQMNQRHQRVLEIGLVDGALKIAAGAYIARKCWRIARTTATLTI